MTALGGPEAQIEPHAAWDTVAYRNAGAMRPDDLHHDRQTQSGSVSTHPLAAPEALEDVRPILCRNARTAVLDADRPLWADLDDDFALWRRMRKGILNEIAQCIGNCSALPGTRTG